MSDPHEYTVIATREGFEIVDEFYELVEPTRAHSSWKSAEERIRELIEEDIAAAEENGPPDPPGWEGGFAENH